MKKMLNLLMVAWISCFIINAFAATDQAAKEETTPPAAEGALTPEQIPPIVSLPEGSNAPAAATVTTPTPSTAAPSATTNTTTQ